MTTSGAVSGKLEDNYFMQLIAVYHVIFRRYVAIILFTGA